MRDSMISRGCERRLEDVLRAFPFFGKEPLPWETLTDKIRAPCVFALATSNENPQTGPLVLIAQTDDQKQSLAPRT